MEPNQVGPMPTSHVSLGKKQSNTQKEEDSLCCLGIPFESNYESTEKTLLQQPTEHLTEVHTEKYDHNVVVKANPTYLYLS